MDGITPSVDDDCSSNAVDSSEVAGLIICIATSVDDDGPDKFIVSSEAAEFGRSISLSVVEDGSEVATNNVSSGPIVLSGNAVGATDTVGFDIGIASAVVDDGSAEASIVSSDVIGSFESPSTQNIAK